MKRITHILILGFVCWTLLGFRLIDRDFNHPLPKNIKTITQFRILIKNGKTVGKEFVRSIRHYDVDGRLIDRYYFLPNDTVSRFTFEYDKEGRLIKEFDHNQILKGKIARTGIYKYSKNSQNPETMISKWASSGNWKDSLKYDNNGNLIEEINFDDKGVRLSNFVYEYNDSNDLIKEYEYRTDYGQTRLIREYKYEYNYDSNSRRLSIKKYFRKGEWLLLETHEYNDKEVLAKSYKDANSSISYSFRYNYEYY